MGKERLAEPGYYIETYGTATENVFGPDKFSVIYISDEGKCKYIHWDWGTIWCTLTWTCAPTKKKVQRGIDAHPDKEIERFSYYPTHEELLTYPLLHHKPAASAPAVHS